MVSSNTFKSIWSMFPTGVSLVTTIEPNGSVHGMPANSISSVSIDPLLVLVCVDHSRDTFKIINTSNRFGINFLSEDQKYIIDQYLSKDEYGSEERSKQYCFTEHGSAMLKNCVAMLYCRVVNQYLAGDHTIFVAEVDGAYLNNEINPLIFFKGEYMKIPDQIIDS